MNFGNPFLRKKQRKFLFIQVHLQKIIGYFYIGKIIEDAPSNIWERCKEDSGIDETGFFKYFTNKEKGYAIEIKDLEIFKAPKDPKKIDPKFRPPQSYYYIK